MTDPLKRVAGVPIVISGPSGVGKGTVIKELLKKRDDLVLSISMTTRPPRPGEQDGVNYFFVDHSTFADKIRHGELLEWAKVYENYYGTPLANLEKNFAAGLDVIIEIDVQGAASARMHYQNGIFVYILPPSLEVLKERLYAREKGAGDDLNRRLALATKELEYMGIYDYVVINDDLAMAAQDLETIILADRHKRIRKEGFLREKGFI